MEGVARLKLQYLLVSFMASFNQHENQVMSSGQQTFIFFLIYIELMIKKNCDIENQLVHKKSVASFY